MRATKRQSGSVIRAERFLCAEHLRRAERFVRAEWLSRTERFLCAEHLRRAERLRRAKSVGSAKRFSRPERFPRARSVGRTERLVVTINIVRRQPTLRRRFSGDIPPAELAGAARSSFRPSGRRFCSDKMNPR